MHKRLHPHTVAFWRSIDDAAIKVVRQPGRTFTVTRLSVAYDGATFLAITLPSGRALHYPFPRLEPGKYDKPMVVIKDNAAGKFTDCRFGQGAYGGLWTENVVQAISRDLLAEAMRRLDAAGYSIVLHVHDEIVAEVPIGFGSLDEFKRLLTALPDWAGGLPVAAKVREGERFSKPSKPKPAAEPISAASCDHDALDDILDGDAATPAPDVIPVAAVPPAEIHAKPASEPPPFVITFDQIRAAEERSRNEAPKGKGNGRDQQAGNGYDHAADRDGYPRGERRGGHTIAVYVYRDHRGDNHTRVEKKAPLNGGRSQYPQSFWVGGEWVRQKPKDWPKIPYCLPELLAAPVGADVFIPEGEKDVESLRALGLVATTSSEGATPAKAKVSKWAPELNKWFHGIKRAFILEDNDEPGRKFAREKAQALADIVSDIRIISFPDVPEGEDVTWWLQHGHTKEELLARCEAASRWQGESEGVLESVRASDVVMRAIEWLWLNRFALGKIGIIAGLPDEGKGQILCYIAARITTHGLEWPNGEGRCPQGNVIILSAE